MPTQRRATASRQVSKSPDVDRVSSTLLSDWKTNCRPAPVGPMLALGVTNTPSCQPVRSVLVMRSDGLRVSMNSASSDRAPRVTLVRKPMSRSRANHSAPSLASSADGIAQDFGRPSRSVNSTSAPQPFPSAARLTAVTCKGADSQTGAFSPPSASRGVCHTPSSSSLKRRSSGLTSPADSPRPPPLRGRDLPRGLAGLADLLALPSASSSGGGSGR